MKIVSWGIIFVIVIFSFSFANRTILNNKMEIMNEEVRYNNAINQATLDATRELSNQINIEDTNVNESYQMVLSAVNTFFETFGLSTGFYGGNQKDSVMKMYVPAISVMTYDGFYISSLENVDNHLEHTLKPETAYSYEDENGKYINFTMDNYVKTNMEVSIYDQQLAQWKEISEGYIVDIRHKYDIEDRTLNTWTDDQGRQWRREEGVCYTTQTSFEGKQIRYEKSFYNLSRVRYLLEEWYEIEGTKETLVEKRMTRYTDNDYNFTRALEDRYYNNSAYKKYLTQGNPENDGFINPITGEYEIGQFNKIRRETITREVTEKLQYYILLHNKFAQANGITYTFTLPEIKDTDWENAIQDVSVFAFVQGISLLNQEYYNNYSFSGARIVDKEMFYGIPPEEDTNPLNQFSDTNLPRYYSSRKISETNRYLLERNNARIFHSAHDAADYGYYPNTDNLGAVVDDVIQEVWDIDIIKSGFNCVRTGDVISLPIIISQDLVPAEIKWSEGVKSRYYFSTEGNTTNSGTNTVNYRAGDVVDQAITQTIGNGTNISWRYAQKDGKRVVFAVINVGIAPSITPAVYTIYFRDVDGTSKVKTVSLDIIDSGNTRVNQTSNKTDTDNNPNNLILGEFTNRKWNNLLTDKNAEYMAYWTKGRSSSVDVDSYYARLKDATNIPGINKLNRRSDSQWQFMTNEYGYYTVFGWDCTGAPFKAEIIILPSMQVTYKIDAYNGTTLVETIYYDAQGNIVSGSIDIEEQITRGVVTVTINRTDDQLQYVEYKKGNFDVDANVSAGIEKYIPNTGTNIKPTKTFELTENNYYTVYVEDTIGTKDCVQINFELITSAFIPNFNNWIIPDVDYQKYYGPLFVNNGNTWKSTASWSEKSRWICDTNQAGQATNDSYNRPLRRTDTNLTFGGYKQNGYNDSIFTKADPQYEIVFRFTINDDNISYHSSRGAGFLFDCTVTEVNNNNGTPTNTADDYKDYNISNGYLLLYEQSSSIKLYRVNSTNLTNIRTNSIGLTLVNGVTGTKLSGGTHETRLEIRQINDSQQSLVLREKNSSGNWQELINKTISHTKKSENAYGVMMLHNSHNCSTTSAFRFYDMSIIQKNYAD